MTSIIKNIHPRNLGALALLGLLGCGTQHKLNNAEKGGLIGAGAGGTTGAFVGKDMGNTALGTVLGAAIGGAAGVLIGKRMDRQTDQIRRNVPGAEVERKGEGIVVTFSSNVLFGFDKSVLTPQAEVTIQELYKVLSRYPDERVLVIGHTDNIGTPPYNQKLSERRARSVASYLIELGLDGSRLQAKGMGETDPKFPNDSEAHRAANRRVEFVITAGSKMKQEASQGRLP